MGPSDSFTWWLINLGIAVIWIAGAVVAHNYFLAIGGLVFVALAMLNELPGTSTEEGTADEQKLIFPLPSETSTPYHSEEELGGSSQGTWRGFGPPPR